MNVFLGNRDIGHRKLGNLQYFDVPAGAFPVPWNQGKECSDPEKCSKNSLQGKFEGVSAEEYRRRQMSRGGMGFTKQELIVPVGGGINPWMNYAPVYWPGAQYMYPVTTPAAPPATASAPENGISTKTLVIGGAIVLTGILAVVLLKKG